MSKQKNELFPELRFPEFMRSSGWNAVYGNKAFEQVSNKDHNSDLPILAITQEYGAIPREMIDYNVSVTEKSVQSYKVVDIGDFIISLRSFQGGIEYSEYKGLCSPAYVILRNKNGIDKRFFKQYFKAKSFIRDLTKNLEGLRDGKMISYKQFSDVLMPKPSPEEQQKIADCLASIDELITLHIQKLYALKDHKKGLMQQLFPAEGETVPKLRFPEFVGGNEWCVCSVEDLISDEVIFSPKDGNHGDIHPKSSDYVSEGIPFVMASDLKNGEVDLIGCSKIAKKQADSLKKGFAKSGDVLITHKGTIGEVAIIGDIPFPYLMLTPQVTYYRVKDKNKLSNVYLAAFFSSDVFQKNLVSVSGGGTRSYIGITEQRKLEVTFPVGLEEQEKIAELFGFLDNSIRSQLKKIQALKVHKEGLMQKLFPVMDDAV